MLLYAIVKEHFSRKFFASDHQLYYVINQGKSWCLSYRFMTTSVFKSFLRIDILYSPLIIRKYYISAQTISFA